MKVLLIVWDSKVTIWDSGVLKHMLPYQEDFIKYEEVTDHTVRIENKLQATIADIGTLQVIVPNEKGLTTMILLNTLYVPQLHSTLISLGQLDKKGTKW